MTKLELGGPFSGNGLVHVEGLRNLEKLEVLCVCGAPIHTKDAAPDFDRKDGTLSDLSPIAGLTALRELAIHRSTVEDDRFLGKLENLVELTLEATPIRALDAIRDAELWLGSR